VSGAAASAAEPFLRLQGVEKRFGSSTVLADVTLDIEDHEFLCLLGPSGCGKTTLLRILCGIESASAGRILRRGEDIAGWPPAARRFGVVFQSYALFPNLSALENVAYGLRGMGRERVNARCREMLDLVGLAAHAGKYPAQLSGGQQQRVALARALAPNPDLLLLDEPLSALDAQVRATLRAEIRRLQQQLHVPTVMVTHDQDEALAIADRVVLMNDGRIVQDASPQALYARPASPFVARFVGRMNLWPARRLDAARVAVGQAEFDCGPGAASGAGSELRLGIRPEAVELLPRDGSAMPWRDGGAAGNTVAATVDGVVFCGAHVVLNLDAPALAQPLEVVCATPPGGALPWHPGDRVHARLPPGALVLVPA
jgi:iron(III) transport system ATP-binding protein